MSEMGSSVPRRQLGRQLRELRDAARMTMTGAATGLECSVQKVWRIESGAVAVRALDVEALCKLYGAEAAVTDALCALARQTKSHGWWHAYAEAVPAYFDLYLGMEAAASHLRLYEPDVVHGLLQTEAYAASVFRLQPGITAEEIEQRVEVRKRRQRLLTRRLPAAPRVEVILGEPALRRRLDDREAMADQLRNLLVVGRLPNVSIRVLPLSAGLTRAVMASGSFAILDFPLAGEHPSEPATVYCADGATGALYLDRPAEIATYQAIWDDVAANSMVEAQSAALIHELAEAPR